MSGFHGFITATLTLPSSPKVGRHFVFKIIQISERSQNINNTKVKYLENSMAAHSTLHQL